MIQRLKVAGAWLWRHHYTALVIGAAGALALSGQWQMAALFATVAMMDARVDLLRARLNMTEELVGLQVKAIVQHGEAIRATADRVEELEAPLGDGDSP